MICYALIRVIDLIQHLSEIIPQVIYRGMYQCSIDFSPGRQDIELFRLRGLSPFTSLVTYRIQQSGSQQIIRCPARVLQQRLRKAKRAFNRLPLELAPQMDERSYITGISGFQTIYIDTTVFTFNNNGKKPVFDKYERGQRARDSSIAILKGMDLCKTVMQPG